MTENDLRLHGQPSNASFNNRDRAVERIPLDQRSQEVTALFQEVIISAHVAYVLTPGTVWRYLSLLCRYRLKASRSSYFLS